MLNYKTLGGDILVFKNQNDCMTIHRGVLGKPWIWSIEVDGEQIDEYDDYNKHPFTPQEIVYFLDNYSEIVGQMY
jgi:hypothetical protein